MFSNRKLEAHVERYSDTLKQTPVILLYALGEAPGTGVDGAEYGLTQLKLRNDSDIGSVALSTLSSSSDDWLSVWW